MQPSAGAEVINLQDGGHRVTDAGVEDTEESVQVPGILEPHRTLSRALTDTRGGHPNSKAPETGSRYAEHRPAVDSHLSQRRCKLRASALWTTALQYLQSQF
jgi:hypothetical protein